MMFYTGQWGGGDSKMLMGLGSLYGIGFSWQDSSFLMLFLINTLVAGAVYGIAWSIFLAIRNWKGFSKEYQKNAISKDAKIARLSVYILAGIMILSSFFLAMVNRIMLLSFAIVILLTYYLWLAIKSVENSSMYKLIEPSKLTEGDWIAKEVKYNGKYICGPKDLGIEKHQINILKKLYREKKIKKVLVKEGIPFVPSFMLGWIMTLAFGNFLNLFFG
jgi:hypothetical protein